MDQIECAVSWNTKMPSWLQSEGIVRASCFFGSFEKRNGKTRA
jgi:hypothetical protein